MRNRNYLIVSILAVTVAVALVAFTGCDTADPVVDNAVTVLKTAKGTWEGFQTQAAEMRSAGRLTDAQWAAWVDLDAKYRASHNAAVQALDIYNDTHGKSAEEALAAALANLTGIIQRAGELISAWKGGN